SLHVSLRLQPYEPYSFRTSVRRGACWFRVRGSCRNGMCGGGEPPSACVGCAWGGAPEAPWAAPRSRLLRVWGCMVRAVGFAQKSDAAYHSPLSKCPQVADENALPVQVSEKRVGKGFAPERKVLALVDRGERQGGGGGLRGGGEGGFRHR